MSTQRQQPIMKQLWSKPVLLVMACLLTGVWGVSNSQAQPAIDLKPISPTVQFQDIKIKQNLGQSLPKGLTFTDHNGQQVKLDDYFQKGQPVILTLAYYGCPGACQEIFNGVERLLGKMTLPLGEQYHVVNVSFDKREKASLALAKREQYADRLKTKGVNSEAWHFLVGDEANITKLTEAAGFPFRWVPNEAEAGGGQFAHGTCIMVMTPDGRFSRYLMGATYDPPTVRQALVEASGGQIGSVADYFIMLCGAFDPNAGKYVLVGWRLMILGCLLTMVALVVMFTILKRKELQKLKKEVMASNAHVQTT